MLKKLFSCLFFITVLSISAVFAQEKSPVIFVDNFKNNGKGNDTIGEILKRSLKMIVELTRKYEVVYSDNLPAYLEKMNLKDIKPKDVNEKYIEANFVKLGIDEVLYGSFTPYNNGDNVEIHVVVLSLADNKVKYDKVYRSTTDVDIFDAIDKIGLDLASVLVGRRLGFGTLIVQNTYNDADIFIDGIKSGKDRVVQNTAIAGLRHRVEIKSKDGITLFNREFEIQDRGTYDLTFGYDETIEVIDETKATNKIKKQDYMKKASGGVFRTGPELTGGGGGFAWLGWYFDFDSITAAVNLTVIPKMPSYVYDWYIGGSLLFSFYALEQNSSWINFYFKTGLIEYFGLKYGFIPNGPYAYFGLGIQFMPDWNWVPTFMRKWKLFIEGGTEQDLGIFWKNFAASEGNVSFNNLGWPMLSIGLKF